MYKFPSIEQFRTVIRNVKHKAQVVGVDADGEYVMDRTRPMPTLTFEGTVKLHGTNAGIVYDSETDSFQYQSRERVLSLEEDNAGFMREMIGKEDVLRELFVSEYTFLTSKVVIYGEWCGGNIQKGVAINGLPKMFVVFAIKTQDTPDSDFVWVKFGSFKTQGIYSIHDFPTYHIDIDFSKPEMSQNRMIEITEEVEAECPVGKYFGNSGIGEGVVWKCISTGWESSNYWFKIKGAMHSVSKVKTLAPVDIEAIESMNAFIDSVVTEARLEQGLDNLVREQLKPFEMSSIGDFIRWIFNDIIKEETDTIVANGFDQKKLGGPVANKAKTWYINKLKGDL
jgi:RNA ligase